MEAEDITRKHTRNEMNAMAKELGIDNPGSYPNKTELAEEMIVQMEDHVYEKELTEKVKEVKELLKKARDTKIDLKVFKKNFKNMREANQNHNLPKAFKLANQLVQQGKSILEAEEKIRDIRQILKQLPDGEVKSDYKNRLSKIIRDMEEGEYLSSPDRLEEVLEEAEKNYEVKDELEDKLSKARSNLSKIRKIDIDIGLLKKLVNQGVKAKKNGDYRKGLERIDEFLSQSEIVLQISDKIKESKSKIKTLRDNSIDYQHYMRVFETAKKKADAGDYRYSLELLKDSIKEMKEDLDKIELEDELSEPGEVSTYAGNGEVVEELCGKLDSIENELEDIKDLLRELGNQ